MPAVARLATLGANAGQHSPQDPHMQSVQAQTAGYLLHGDEPVGVAVQQHEDGTRDRRPLLESLEEAVHRRAVHEWRAETS